MRRHVGTVLVTLAATVGATLCVAYAPPSDAATRWQQPYGGCKEAWQAPRSEGARECRAHGWTVYRWIVLNPDGIVRYYNPNRMPGNR